MTIFRLENILTIQNRLLSFIIKIISFLIGIKNIYILIVQFPYVREKQ